LAANGQVEAWGPNGNGQDGDGTTTDRATPVDVSGLGSGSAVKQVVSGGSVSFAVMADGTVKSWGQASLLGTGATSDATTPTTITGLTGVTQIAADDSSHVLALKADGTVWAWGANDRGELGDGTTTDETTPEEVPGLSNVVQIATGEHSSIALEANGTVWTWGANNDGQLGLGTTTDVDSPTEVTGLPPISSIAGGAFITIAVAANGTVWTAGADWAGQLGQGQWPDTADTFGQVQGVAGAQSTYSYDAAGNPTTLGGNTDTVTTAGFDQAGQLCWTDPVPQNTDNCDTPPSGAMTYSYNDEGDQTSVTPAGGTATDLGYDQANRLTSYGTTISYTYDGNGLRTSKTVSGTTSHFVYDTTTATPTVLTDGTNAYLYGPAGEPIEQINISTGTVYWLHTDQQGSVRAITNTAGTVVGTTTYSPYGAVQATTDTVTSPLGYAGAYTDTETGLLYLINRYYNPNTAQFLTVDPMVAETGSAYGYVDNNPVNGTDPTGLLCLGHYCLGFHPLAGAKGAVNFFAGAANFATTTVSGGRWRISQPFCGGTLNASYDIGQGTAGAETLIALGAGLAGGAEADAGAAADTANEEAGDSDITFGHGARHLAGTGLQQGEVEAAIQSQVEQSVAGASSTGSFWGRVVVNGQTIEYRAYTLPSGTINIGTYYVVP
jgi:RHS repeat-associated protein